MRPGLLRVRCWKTYQTAAESAHKPLNFTQAVNDPLDRSYPPIRVVPGVGENGIMPATTPFAIVTICTGNICRSPAMDLLLAHELAGAVTDDVPRFRVSSAGTHAMTGWPVNPPMDRLLEAHGVDVEGFAAQQATAPLLNGADLILTATREHREWVVEHAPSTVRRAFTVTEFADAVARAEAAAPSPAALVDWAAAHRPSSGVVSRSRTTRRGYAEGDILDPYGLGDAAYDAAFAQIATATEAIASALRVSALRAAKN